MDRANNAVPVVSDDDYDHASSTHRADRLLTQVWFTTMIITMTPYQQVRCRDASSRRRSMAVD